MNDLSGRRVERSDGFTYVVYPMPFGPWQKRTTMTQILEATSTHCKISVEDMKAKGRPRRVVYARHIAMYLCTQDATGKSLPQIGGFFGGRDHTTVINARDKIKTLLENDCKLRKDVKTIRALYAGPGST